MTKVLMIGPSLDSRGGIAAVEKQYIDGGLGDLCELTFLPTTEPGGPIRKVVRFLRSFLYCFLHISRFDVLHVHLASRRSYERKSLFIRLARSRGVKVVIHLHGGKFDTWFENDCDDRKKSQVRSDFNNADMVIALSSKWAAFLRDRVCDAGRVSVLPNSVPLSPETEDRAHSHNVLFLGRVTRGKGADLLLKAAQGVIERIPDATFFFGGEGDIPEYEACARSLGIAHRCHFLGWVTDDVKERLFRKSLIFCLPSLAEGLPVSMLEAMSHGLVPIVTPVGGVSQVIEDGVNGLLTTVGDDKKLAENICLLMLDPEFSGRLSANGRGTIEQRYNLTASIERLGKLYTSLCVEVGR